MSIKPKTIKGKVRNFVRNFGIELIYFNSDPSGEERYPFGDMGTLLEDLRARGLDCQVVLDIGANKGGWVSEALAVFHHASAIMIEPLQEMQSSLETICKHHSGSRVFIAGAGAEDGSMGLNIGKDLAGATFMGAKENSGDAETREVPLRAIDSLLASEGLPFPELVKIDVQGFELEVLKGAESLFGKAEVFIIETSFFPSGISSRPVFSEIVKYMEERGYVIYDFAGFLRRPLDGALGQADPVFVKRDGLFRQKLGWSS